MLDSISNITNYYLLLSAALFSVGTLGVLVRRNAIIVFMCIELMLNGVNISLVAVSREYGHLDGEVFVFFVMAVAAAEASVGLAIILAMFKHFRSVQLNDARELG